MPHSSTQSLSTDSVHPGQASDHFDHLCAAQTLRSILTHYRRLCAALELTPARFPDFYPKLKANLQSWKAQGLLSKFDKRAAHKCYNRGQACVDTKVLVIGAGPCGLRAAIEAQLLGAKVVVLEKRDRLSRNNVLHLWPMVIHDLKALGAKKFFGKFCAGAIDHISIRQLQCILLKVALLLGVELHENVSFEELLEPTDERTGWRARLSPANHPAADFQFDVLIGADGKRNTFKCFRRKEFRGKLAIAITANFVNRHTEAEARVDEISGVAFIFNQKFFNDLSAATGIDLENIVYYKDETHYFVMTAKKQSLLAKGVILKDYMDTCELLSPSNIDRGRLMDFAREAADFSTESQLPELQFAVNHYGLEDVAMFDFTCMYASCYASTVTVRHGHGLLLQLVGDSLLEPFWPTGSGCARGFLSCFDAAWQIRSWANPRLSTLECLAERETTYRLLAQTTPKNLSSDLSGYSLDPRTRYPNLNLQAVLPHLVRHMVDTDAPEALAAELALATAASSVPVGQQELPAHKRPYQPIEAAALLRWCQRRLHQLQIEVTDLSVSFQSGEVICGLLQSYRPDLLQLSTAPEEPLARWRLALHLLQQELAVPPSVPAEQLVDGDAEWPQLVVFLSRVYDALHGVPPAAAPRPHRITEMAREDDDSSQRASPVRPTPEGRHTAAGDTMRRHRKRRSEAAHQRASRMTPEVKKEQKQDGPELSKKEQFASKVKDLEAKFSGTYQPPDKKPKPVSRVIGRIEKDWNLQQIEKKIEENSRPFVSRDKDYPVPRWNRDAFDDKFQTMQSKSGGDGMPFRRFDYGQRGSNHVSAMAARFGNGHRPAAPAPAQGTGVTVCEFCHFCGQRVFLVDRMVAEKKVFHPRCFRCEYCSVTLKPGNYEYDAEAGRFFCVPHYGLHSLVKYKYQRTESTTTVPPCPSPVTEQMRSHLSLRGVTPERAEFENSVCDPMSEEELLSEIDEDEWTDRNFLTTEEVLSGADCSDSDSCTPDSDQFEPALDEEEVLRLAERWRRLHGQPDQQQQDQQDQQQPEPDSDLYESDGVSRAGDVSDTGHHSETEEEASARLRRRAEDGLTEHVLQSGNVRKRTAGKRSSQSCPGSGRSSQCSAVDSSSAASDSDSDSQSRPPPPRIVVQDSDGLLRTESGVPGLRPEPIGAERDSGSGSGEQPPSQERVVADTVAGQKGKEQERHPRREIKKKMTGSIPVLKKPVTSLINRSMGKPAAKYVTTARVSVGNPMQQKPNKTSPGPADDAMTRPAGRDGKRDPALRSRPPASDSAAWRHSTELKRQSVAGSPPGVPVSAAAAPARSRSAAELGSRASTASSRAGQGQQTGRAAAAFTAEGARKPAPARQTSAAEVARPAASKIPSRPQPAPRGTSSNGVQVRPVPARRASPPDRKTSAPAKLSPEKPEPAKDRGKVETSKMGKTAPIRRGSGGNRVAAIAARDRVRRQVKENLLKQRLARKAREETSRSNGKVTDGRQNGAPRRRGSGSEETTASRRSADDGADPSAVDDGDGGGVSAEDWGDGEDRRGSLEREDSAATSGSSERDEDSPNAERRRRSADKLSSSPDKLSSSPEGESASETVSGCEMAVVVRLPGPEDDDDVHMCSSSPEEEDSGSERVAVNHDHSDAEVSSGEGYMAARSTQNGLQTSGSGRRQSPEISRRHEDEAHERSLHPENEPDDIRLSLCGAEDFIDEEALEQRWQQMLGDDELMETEEFGDKLEYNVDLSSGVEAAQPCRVPDEYHLVDDAGNEIDDMPSSPSNVNPAGQLDCPVSSEEGDTFVEFDALLNDVDVTNLERGFDEICDETASEEEFSSEGDSSGHGNITVTEVIPSDRDHTDDDRRSPSLGRKGSPVHQDHYSDRSHDDAESDVSEIDSITHENGQLSSDHLPSVESQSRSPDPGQSVEQLTEDPVWVTADSHTLNSRGSESESGESGGEESAWQTAESATLDDSGSAVGRGDEDRVTMKEDVLPEEEESMSEEELEEPAWKSASVLREEDAVSSDAEDHSPGRRESDRREEVNQDPNVTESPLHFQVDESCITFRRRRRRRSSPPARVDSPDEYESDEPSPEKVSPRTSPPPPIIDLTQDSPEPTVDIGTNDEPGIEASMEYDHRWVDEWREADDTVADWMSEARREQGRTSQPAEDLSIELEPAVDEVMVMETRPVPQRGARRVSVEAVITTDPGVSSVWMVAEPETMGSPEGGPAHDSVPLGEVFKVAKDNHINPASLDKHTALFDKGSSGRSTEHEPIETRRVQLEIGNTIDKDTCPEDRSPSPAVLPELRLFGGDETADIVSSRKRSSARAAASKGTSLRERIKAVESIPPAGSSRPGKVITDGKRDSESDQVSQLIGRTEPKNSDRPTRKGPTATSTPMAAARPSLTTLPTPITRTDDAPAVPESALSPSVGPTLGLESAPVWEWETPSSPRPPPSVRPPPIPTDSGPPSPRPAPRQTGSAAGNPQPSERRPAAEPLPALAAPAAVLAATATATGVPAVNPASAPDPAPVPAPVAPVATRQGSHRSPVSPVEASVAPEVSPVSPEVTPVSPVSPEVTPVSPVSPEVTPVSPVSPAVTPVSPVSLTAPEVSSVAPEASRSAPAPFRSARVGANVGKTRPAPVRVTPLGRRVWPPVSPPPTTALSGRMTAGVSPPAVPISPTSPTSPVTPTSPTTAIIPTPRATATKPTLPALSTATSVTTTGKTPKRVPPKLPTIPSASVTTTANPTSPTTPTTPVTPVIPVPPPSPAGPVSPPRFVNIRVSPLVEEASARLLRRGATEPSLVLPPRSALSGAPMRLSRLPEDCTSREAASREAASQERASREPAPQESATQERPPEESLIRDLVLSRVRRSPEKHLRKRVTSPAVLGTSGPSVRPLPPPVPGGDPSEEGEPAAETETVLPPPPLTQTRLIRVVPPPPPPPSTEIPASWTTLEHPEEPPLSDTQTEADQLTGHSAEDRTTGTDLTDHQVPSTPTPEVETALKESVPVPEENPEEEEPAAPVEKAGDEPPPLPDKTRSSARLSLIPAAARALFSPPRRPPRASDQRTPRRKKQSSAVRKAVASLPPAADGGVDMETAAGRRAVSETREPQGRTREEEVTTVPLTAGAAPEMTSALKRAALSAEPRPAAAVSAESHQKSATVPTETPAAPLADESGRSQLSVERDSAPPEGSPQPVQSQKPATNDQSPDGAVSGDPAPGHESGHRPESAAGGSQPAGTATSGQTAGQTAGQRDPTLSAVTEEQVSQPAPPAADHATSKTRKKESSDLKKKRERRRSIIQAISDIFRHSTDKKEKDKEDKTDTSSPSKKEKEKESPVAVIAPSGTDPAASPGPTAVPATKPTPLRSRLGGLRFRKSKDKEKKLSASPSLSPPDTPVSADRTDGTTGAADRGLRPPVGPEPKVTPSGRSSPEGTLSRRSRSGRAARHSEIRRQQRAQELQRQLGEVEVRQQELQLCAAELEKTIRGEPHDGDGGGDGVLTDDAVLMRDWFGLVHERSLLVRRDQLLQLQLQELQLEDRHDRLQLELRERMAAPEAQKTAGDIERERELVNTLLEISEQRRSLRQAMDAEQDALRAECESAETRQQLLAGPPDPAPLEESTV